MSGEKRIGRPPEPVPQDVADEVVEWIAEGKTLREYCRQEGKPSRATVDRWRAKDDAFASRFARAREIGFDMLAEECLEIARTPQPGVVTTEDKDGTKTVTEDMLGHRKHLTDTILKLLAKWSPKKYGAQAEAPGMTPSERIEAWREMMGLIPGRVVPPAPEQPDGG